MDRTLYVFASSLSQVPVEVAEKHATNLTVVADESVRKKGSDGAAERRPTWRQATQYQSDDFAVKVNGTAVIKDGGF